MQRKHQQTTPQPTAILGEQIKLFFSDKDKMSTIYRKEQMSTEKREGHGG